MYLRAFGLREDPFGVTPNPRFLYMSASHREALASLVHGIEAERGFIALIAEPGMGKTTLLTHVLEAMRTQALSISLFQTQCSRQELLRYMLADLGMPVQTDDVVALHEQFNEVLVNTARTGKRFIVVIDEAQNLSDDVLEAVRLLSDFETPSRKLLQIILSGQPKLGESLARSEMWQLRQRMSIICHLHRLDVNEVLEYIEHRLRVAGRSDPLFTPEAVETIAACSGGIPRLINNYCFNLLSLAYALDQPLVTAAMVDEISQDLAMGTDTGPHGEPHPAKDSYPRLDVNRTAERMRAIHAVQIKANATGPVAQPPVAQPSAPAPVPTLAADAWQPSTIGQSPEPIPASEPVRVMPIARPAPAQPASIPAYVSGAAAPATAPAEAPRPKPEPLPPYEIRTIEPKPLPDPLKEIRTVIHAEPEPNQLGDLDPKPAPGSLAGFPLGAILFVGLMLGAVFAMIWWYTHDSRAETLLHSPTQVVAEPEGGEPVFRRSGVDKQNNSNTQRGSRPPAPASSREQLTVSDSPIPKRPAVTDPTPPPVRGTGIHPALPTVVAATSPAMPQLKADEPQPQSEVVPGRLLKTVNPKFPVAAGHGYSEGTVVLMATINAQGDVESLEFLSGDRFFAPSAMDSVRKWKYSPYTLNGKPVPVQTKITIHFRP